LLPEIDTHEGFAVIDHVQSRVVAIVSDPDPPLAANEEGELVTVMAHFAEVGAVTEVEAELQAASRKASPTASATVARRSAEHIRNTGAS
jgi:hypothetical protein